MPCYQTQTCNVEMGANTDQELLEKALQEEGYQTLRQNKQLTFNKASQQINGTFADGKLNITAPRTTKVDTDAIKRGYSKQVIKAKAKKHGFKVEQKPGTNKFILSKIANRM